MTSHEAEAIFVQNGVPTSFYSLQQPGSDTWVLEAAPDRWNLYYSERGNRFEETSYATEHEASVAWIFAVNKMLVGDGKNPLYVPTDSGLV